MEERHIGYEIRVLKNMIGHLIDSYQYKLDEQAGITQVQSWIIGYLYHNQKKDVFQKDVEAQFHVAGSTATGILKTMEKKGLITRQPLERDARMKRIVLTDQGMAFHREIMVNMDHVQEILLEEIPPADLETFFKVVEQLKHNIEKEMKGETPTC